MKIILRPPPAIAPREKQLGAIIDVLQQTGTDTAGEPFDRVTVALELDAKDSAGKAYIITKEYNLLGRGFAAFCEDFKLWKGRSLTKDEIEGFNPEVLIKGERVVAEIVHRKKGTEWTAAIKSFQPPESNPKPTN